MSVAQRSEQVENAMNVLSGTNVVREAIGSEVRAC